MDYLENRTFDEIQIGDSASLTRTLTEKDIQVFAIMSGDINPAHVDEEFAHSDMFHKIIGHGMWSGALISTVLGTQLPGPGTIYLSQTIQFKKPVAIGDVLTVTVIAIEKNPEKNRIIFSCECINQLNEVVIKGQAEVIAPTKKIRRQKAVMPEINLRRPPYQLFDDYLKKAKELGPAIAAVIFPNHKRVIHAIDAATKAGMITPIFIGQKEKIIHAASDAKIDINNYEIIDVENAHAAINKAIMLAREDKVDLLIRGSAIRVDLIHAMQKHEKGLVIGGHISYASVLDIPTYPKPLIMTDTLINVEPTLEIKRDIIQNAIDFALSLGINEPKVAILAGMDVVNSSMRSTIDAAALCKMAERGQIKGGILDGPLTFDNAISKEISQSRGIISAVAGNADILIVPNVETGSILKRQLEYLTESRSVGLVLGARVPVLMSHIDDICLSTISTALAILNKRYKFYKGESYEQGK